MSISSIEQDRSQLGISQKVLCAAAEVHETTYSAIKNGRSGGRVATLERLRDALQRLREEMAADPAQAAE